ncbi:MAG: lamin tail domain-containing protein, partial [Verrucomicrobiae bacterium]|nr:lamin tail domain-containing protein [Verrucomicrobiae bacterium]
IKAVYGITNVIGNWNGKLANEGGAVRLCKASGAIVLEVNYRPKPPWPLAASGTGHSLVLARPSLGENDPRAWAASATCGGSPGSDEPMRDDPLDNLVISEVVSAPAPGEHTWIELHNASAWPVDVSRCVLATESKSGGFLIPRGTILGPNEFLVLAQTETRLVLNRAGGRVFLFAPERTRVIDAVEYRATEVGASQGRTTLLPGALRELQVPTPGTQNAPPRISDIVISEIMFDPLSGDDRDEYIELHNRGTNAIDLSGWRFVDGIEFVFPQGATLPAGGWLVVVPDVGRFRETHPDVPSEVVFGNYSGALSNKGERIALAKPVYHVGSASPVWAVASEAMYRERALASTWAEGGGSSLELIDLRSDPLDPDNWVDSDESAKAAWTLIETTGVLDHMHPAFAAADQLQVMLLGPGEALVDAVDVRIPSGPNLVGNGQFEITTSPWLFQGTHRLSRREPTIGFNSSSSLRLVAVERGDHVANCARVRLSSQIPSGQVATIRARVKWLVGHPETLLRLRGGGLEASGRLATPLALGTPGKPNSRTLPNSGPAIRDVIHRPVLPLAGQPVRVMARVQDPDGVSQVTLRYRRDGDQQMTSVQMWDDGTGADDLAGDGVFTGTIPGQLSGVLVCFRIKAEDCAKPAATSTFPVETQNRECLVRWDEQVLASAFGSYRIWMTKENHDFWAAREKMSNEDIPVTFVYGSHRIIYCAGARYSGSSYTAPSYNSPTGNLCGYDISFPKYDRFLGDTHVTLDWPIRDGTNLREPLMYWFLEKYGLPNMYRRHVHLFVNGIRRGVIYDDTQQPGADTVEEWFPDDPNGTLWKTDCWNEFDDAGNRIDPCILNTLENFVGANGRKKTERYRWNWRPRAVHGSANDFTDLFALVDAVNSQTDYPSRIESLIDLDHWMRTFAMNDLASFWDAFGNPNGKNTFLYKPIHNRWKLMCWDFDVGLGVFNDPPTAPLFDVNDPTIARMYQTPALVRLYWGALEQALNDWFRVGPGSQIDAFLDARYNAFRADGLALASPDGIKSWIAQRREFLMNQLKTVRSDLTLSTPPAFTQTTQNPIVLRGTAPVTVRTLTVNGIEYPVYWSTLTNWEIRVPLSPGTNRINLTAYDASGRINGTLPEILVLFTGNLAPLPPVRINEWMASNRAAVMDPADKAFDDWFELYNAGDDPVPLGGWWLTDSLNHPAQFVVPSGFILPPRGFLLVWADGQPAQSTTNGAIHTSFQLKKKGETIALFNPDGRLVDAVAFGGVV